MRGNVKENTCIQILAFLGAGKTTLLDVLAKRKNIGTVEGTLLINGKPPDKYYHRYIGYVEQNDIHLPSQTVQMFLFLFLCPHCCFKILEAVSFAARSRLPAYMDDSARSAVVQRVLKILDLTSIAGQQVGYFGGLNPEQRKSVSFDFFLFFISLSNPFDRRRLTIAVELATNPQLLFLDEPTSGLG